MRLVFDITCTTMLIALRALSDEEDLEEFLFRPNKELFQKTLDSENAALKTGTTQKILTITESFGKLYRMKKEEDRKHMTKFQESKEKLRRSQQASRRKKYFTLAAEDVRRCCE
ncbi:hypothetical protein Trydic_g19069 [Trypoxylus dichotomus]